MSSKTDRICEELEKKILSGQWQEGDKIPPFSMLMKEFDVSKGMIQYAIGKLVSRGFLHTVQGQGTFVGMDKAKRLNEIVVLMVQSPEEQNILADMELEAKMSIRTQQILSGAQKEALANNIKLVYSEIDSKNTQQNQDYLLSYNSGDILGMVVLGPITPELRPILRKVQYPVVLTCDLTDPRHRLVYEIDIITNDLHLSSLIATEKLLAANHNRIGFISTRPIVGWSGLFHAGWKSAVAGAGIEIKAQDTILPQLSDSQDYYQVGYELAEKLGKKDYTAYFVVEEQVALGVFEGLMDRGVRVPEDISIASTADMPLRSSRYNMNISVSLSSSYHIGRSAIYRVMDTRKYGANPGRHTIVGTWNDGDSIAPAKAAR